MKRNYFDLNICFQDKINIQCNKVIWFEFICFPTLSGVMNTLTMSVSIFCYYRTIYFCRYFSCYWYSFFCANSHFNLWYHFPVSIEIFIIICYLYCSTQFNKNNNRNDVWDIYMRIQSNPHANIQNTWIFFNQCKQTMKP